jgi:hypothetical protein
MLAARLREVFADDELAIRLGESAHQTALKRHEPGLIIPEILAAYEDVLRKAQ